MAQIYWTYEELLADVEHRAQSVEVLGHTVNGSPLVVARGGGDKLPAIFITAGSHSTEQAGVSAAVACIDELETDHQVHVIPTRDPVGMQGFAHVLSLGLGTTPTIESFDQVETILRDGEVLFEEEDLTLSLIGEYGYASARPGSGRSCPQYFFYQRLQRLASEQPEVLEPLRGRRVWMTPGQTGVAGTGDFGRAYTLIISLEGEILHINRFHDTAWAPVEARVTRDLMAQIHPGLTLDLHEHGGDGFWFSARHQGNDDDERWEQHMADAMIAAVTDSGAALMPDDYLPGSFFTKSQNSVYWLDPRKRGEGFNLSDFGALHYGPAFTVETGMTTGFDNRVRSSILAAQTAIGVFEKRHA